MNAPSQSLPLDRRALGRALSRAADASVEEILAAAEPETTPRARRIGITGPPGAGKSTLIAALARHRLRRTERLAIVAIDPTSPNSRGSILGDRIRMDGLIDDPRVFIRSLPSRRAADGLTENLPEILAVLDRYGFDEVLLETVGVGQTEYGVRDLVDIELLVLVPGSGDQIQAMKAGILETADIYVVNKADQPGAERVEAELRSVLTLVKGEAPCPPIVRCRSDTPAGLADLDAALQTSLLDAADDGASAPARLRRRARSRVRSLLLRRLDEVLDRLLPPDTFDAPLAELHARILRDLAARTGPHDLS